MTKDKKKLNKNKSNKSKKSNRNNKNNKKNKNTKVSKNFLSIIKKFLLKNNNSTNFSLIEVIIVASIAILFGIVVGYLINFSKSLTSDSRVEEIISTYNDIIEQYYEDVDKDKLSSAAIRGMVESLDDPYSNYLDSSESSDFNEQLDGSFVGIGVVVMYTGEYNKIIEVYEDEPAFKAGMKVDDLLLAVDDVDVKEVYGDNLVKLIRGKKDTFVKIKVLRGEEEIELNIKRGKVDIKSVSNKIYEVDDKKIGYIRIDSFAANTDTQFIKNLKELEEKNINSLIIDVRDNPGGHLLQTRNILSLFFDKKTVVYQLQTKTSKKKIYSNSSEVRNYPVAILTNSGSASASEVLTSCFKENYKNVVVIGTKTYGKGTVQKSQSLNAGNSIKFTTEKWLTSKGDWLNKKGIEPDIEVKLQDAYYEDPTEENDNQLQEAIKQLKESN